MKTRLRFAIPIVYFLLTTLVFSLISFSRYNQGQLFYYDFGIFTHIIWQLSRFQTPIINHLALGQIIFLGDHFNPLLALFAPLFWLTSDARILLVQQAAAIAASGFVVFKIAQRLELSKYLAVAASTAFLLFAGTQNPLVTDWHPESTAGLFLLIFFYLIVFTSRLRLALLFLSLFIGLKESNAISAIILLMWIYFLRPDIRKKVAVLAGGALIYFLLITKLVIPYFSHSHYMYTPETPLNPIRLVVNFFDSAEKQRLIYDSLISFAFLPLFSGVGLLVPLAELAIRLVPDRTIFNNITLGQHYNVLLGCFLALTTIYGIKKVQSKYQHKYVPQILFAGLIIISLYTARKITGSPINLIINPVFRKEFLVDPVIREVTTKVSAKGTVMGQNNLLAYTATRTEQIMLLNPTYAQIRPDYILIDLREGQNINNYYGSTLDQAKKIVQALQTDPQYHREPTDATDLFIYKRN